MTKPALSVSLSRGPTGCQLQLFFDLNAFGEAVICPKSGVDALSRYDDNGNGRITCAEARKHGIAPVPRSHPAYRFMRDSDGDGIVCE